MSVASDEESHGPIWVAIAALPHIKKRDDITISFAYHNDYGRVMTIENNGKKLAAPMFIPFYDYAGPEIIKEWRKTRRTIQSARPTSAGAAKRIYLASISGVMSKINWVFTTRDAGDAELFGFERDQPTSITFTPTETAVLLEMLEEVYSEWIAAGEHAAGLDRAVGDAGAAAPSGDE